MQVPELYPYSQIISVVHRNYKTRFVILKSTLYVCTINPNYTHNTKLLSSLLSCISLSKSYALKLYNDGPTLQHDQCHSVPNDILEFWNFWNSVWNLMIKHMKRRDE